MSKKLCIVSVHAPSEYGEKWYELQREFVFKNTTCDFEYKIILNGVNANDFRDEDIKIVNDENIGHAPALAQAIEYFRASGHDACLILDSDCFPIKRGWHEILIPQMKAWGKPMAAVIRTENLDLYPHPCAFLILTEGLSEDRFEFQKGEAVNLLGEIFEDVGSRMTGAYDKVFPLIRTNVINVHPMAAGIYHHLFYHQHAASRDFNCRVIDRYHLHDHWYQRDNQLEHATLLQQRLFDDPERFINYLCGYAEPTASRYIKGLPARRLKTVFSSIIPQILRDRFSQK